MLCITASTAVVSYVCTDVQLFPAKMEGGFEVGDKTEGEVARVSHSLARRAVITGI